MRINKKQSGFTLIELVVVIVILGILAATALPRFVDLSNDANEAAAAGIAGAITSGSTVNYATYLARRVNATGAADTPGGTVINTTGACTLAVANSLLSTGSAIAAADYTVGGPTTALAMGGEAECTLTPVAGGAAANFTIIGAR